MNEPTLVPREEMSDLDWLARNVHEWPAGDYQPWCYVYMAHDGVMEASGNFLDAVAKHTMITIYQWLARRAELQNKPSWGAVPSHANWLAQDAAGSWLWHSSEPECRNGGWIGSTTRGYAAKGCVLGDWRDTLEKRPEQAKFEPFVSVEDAKLTIMQSDGDVKHFGGIIGRRLPLEEDAATAKNCDQVVTINIKPDSTLIHQPHGRIKRITTSKYTKTIHGVSVDVYDVLQAWGVSNPALQHLIKKALQCGRRGHKDNAQDLQDIIDSAIRAKELES